jgi:thioredoxin reductase
MRHYAPAAVRVAVIGAGPYGLSIAAHLRARGIECRIFGNPMYGWREQMPDDMFLKSEGFASCLYEPEGRYTLKRYCAENGLPYRDIGLPVLRKTFADYGVAFQRRFVPDVEEKKVAAIDGSSAGWQLRLDSGETIAARQVVIAIGGNYFNYLPTTLADLPPEFVSHSSDHCDLSRFKGREVTVIGGGASACDVAASLAASGAQARIVARQPQLLWTTPAYEPLWERLYPGSGLGGGWRNRFFENLQLLFRRLPEERRLRIVKTHLGPRAGWPVKSTVERLPLLLDHSLRSADVRGGRARLVVVDSGGTEREVTSDHIIAATGFKVDVKRLSFLNKDIRDKIRTVVDTPILSDDFESSVPGLYFAGLAAANTFGPSMRFVIGARFAARRLAKRLAQPVSAT